MTSFNNRLARRELEGAPEEAKKVLSKISNPNLENRDSFLKELGDKYGLTKRKKSARTSDNRAQTPHIQT